MVTFLKESPSQCLQGFSFGSAFPEQSLLASCQLQDGEGHIFYKPGHSSPEVWLGGIVDLTATPPQLCLRRPQPISCSGG